MYQWFVKGSANIAAPPNRNTGKIQPFQFETISDPEYVTFEELKRRLVSPPILTLPHFGQKYKLDTDACGLTVLQRRSTCTTVEL